MADDRESRYKRRRKRGEKNQGARRLDYRPSPEMDLSTSLKNRLGPKHGNGNCQPSENHFRNTYSSLCHDRNYATGSLETEESSIRLGRSRDNTVSARNELFRRLEIKPGLNNNKRTLVSYDDLDYSDHQNNMHRKKSRSEDTCFRRERDWHRFQPEREKGDGFRNCREEREKDDWFRNCREEREKDNWFRNRREEHEKDDGLRNLREEQERDDGFRNCAEEQEKYDDLRNRKEEREKDDGFRNCREKREKDNGFRNRREKQEKDAGFSNRREERQNDDGLRNRKEELEKDDGFRNRREFLDFREIEQPYSDENDEVEQMHFESSKNFGPVRKENNFHETSMHYQRRSSQSLDTETFVHHSHKTYRAPSIKDDLAAELVCFLHRHGNRVKLDVLENSKDYLFRRIKNVHNYSKIKHFVDNYEDIFNVTEAESDGRDDVDFLSHNFSLELCERYCQQINSCDGSCRKIHICRFFIMGSCKIDHDQCMYRHMFSTEHNYAILKEMYCHKIDDDHLKELLLSPRTTLTLPRICTYYNAKGCDKENNCPFLHVCKHYIIGNCKHPRTCKREHEFSCEQPFGVLRKFRLADFVRRPGKEQILLGMLKPVIEAEAKYADKKEGFAVLGTPFKMKLMGNVGDRYRGQPNTPHIDDLDCWWTIQSSNSTFEGSLEWEAQRKLEQRYQLYLKSKKYILQVDKEDVEVNFETMEGICSTKDGKRYTMHFNRGPIGSRYFSINREPNGTI